MTGNAVDREFQSFFRRRGQSAKKERLETEKIFRYKYYIFIQILFEKMKSGACKRCW